VENAAHQYEGIERAAGGNIAIRLRFVHFAVPLVVTLTPKDFRRLVDDGVMEVGHGRCSGPCECFEAGRETQREPPERC